MKRENLRFPAVFCENLHLPNAAKYRKSEYQQKSMKISEKLQKTTANLAPFVPFSLSLLIPPHLKRKPNTGVWAGREGWTQGVVW